MDDLVWPLPGPISKIFFMRFEGPKRDTMPDVRVCNYCNGSGLEDRPSWARDGRGFNWTVPDGLVIPDDKQLCFGCHGRKMVPNCPHCAKGPLIVKCETCLKSFELVPSCMNRALPLAGAHIKYGMGSHYVQLKARVGDTPGEYVDFCSGECKAEWKLRNLVGQPGVAGAVGCSDGPGPRGVDLNADGSHKDDCGCYGCRPRPLPGPDELC